MKSADTSNVESQQYFSVSTSAVIAFSQLRPSALAICSYLVLSRYSIKSSNKTAASSNIISKRLHKGIGPARNAIKELLDCHTRECTPALTKHVEAYDFSAVCSCPEDHQSFINELLLENARKVKFPRYTFPRANHSIKISNSLIDEHSEKLERLIRGNNISACILLLLMHHYYDYGLDAVKRACIATESKKPEIVYQVDGVTFWSGTTGKHPLFNELLIDYVSSDKELDQAGMGGLLNLLEDVGLVQRLVYVVVHDANSDNAPIHYELGIKTGNVSEKRAYHNLAYRMRKFAQDRGCNIGRKDNRFYNDYVFAAPSGQVADLVVLYRLPFAMRNPNNLGFQKGADARRANNEKACSWLETAEKDRFR
jgi:hypothetical protein